MVNVTHPPSAYDAGGNLTNISAPSADPVEVLLNRESRFLQPIWDLRLGYEDYLQSPLFPVFLSVFYYFGLCIPVTFIDVFCKKQQWYKNYKIQPDKEITAAQLWDTLSLTMWNHVLFIMPAAMAQWVWTPSSPLPELAPTLFDFLWHQIAGLFIFDFQYYVWHMTHHKVRFLYRHIHAVHHRYNSPFVWVTQYLHPWELVVTGFLTTTNTWFFDSHPLTVWSYMVVSITISVEDHVGFDFPFSLHNMDPTGNFGGSPKHDMHHQKPLTNFEPFFNHFDKMFGSFCPPMGPGGLKSKALLDYERKAKECKKNF
ncbi:cholesterol 25-hydroxylase-like protein 1, member 2 [Elysia marginata]|uniref:Cholesterol 25-hydroxylase-like protein 1, member 2 n=1 Tax=Elysia marginata TaxID=1093978 RepID=A0AAV4IG91_9GAST|nr:cholesterol 25-hydroxylase-like protein 1, member 2 [Elysia marginata]